MDMFILLIFMSKELPQLGKDSLVLLLVCVGLLFTCLCLIVFFVYGLMDPYVVC